MQILSGLIISMALPCMIGYALLLCLCKDLKFGLSMSLAVSFGLGLGILTQSMLLMDIIGLPYSQSTIICSQIILILIILLFSFQRLKIQKFISISLPRKLKAKGRFLEEMDFLGWIVLVATLMYLGYYVFYIFWAALNIPVYTWDSFATCVYNAKVIYFEGSLTDLKQLAHRAYPLHVPMILSWISFNLGRWNDQVIKIVFPLAFLALVVIYRFFLAQYTNTKWALLGIVLLFSSNLLIFHATISYRDIFLSYYLCSAIIFLLLWQDKRQDQYLILSSLFIGFASFTKLEGAAYLMVMVVVLMVILWSFHKTSIRHRISILFRYSIPCVLIFAVFYIYKLWKVGAGTEYIEMDVLNSLTRLPLVVGSFLNALFMTSNWNILFGILVFSLVHNFSKVKVDRNIQVLLLALGMCLGAHFILAVLSAQGDHIITSHTISRLILQMLPILTMLIVLLNFQKANN